MKVIRRVIVPTGNTLFCINSLNWSSIDPPKLCWRVDNATNSIVKIPIQCTHLGMFMLREIFTEIRKQDADDLYRLSSDRFAINSNCFYVLRKMEAHVILFSR